MPSLAILALTIRLYDLASVPQPVLQGAVAEASRVLQGAAGDVRWVECPLHGRSASACDEVLAPGEVIVRIARAPQSASHTGVLGHAVVDRSRREGTVATVWASRVSALASAVGRNIGVLLGRAMAHEIGHLLLGRTTHPVVGLMRGSWSIQELRREQDVDWRFTDAEEAEIRLRAHQRGLATPAQTQ